MSGANRKPPAKNDPAQAVRAQVHSGLPRVSVQDQRFDPLRTTALICPGLQRWPRQDFSAGLVRPSALAWSGRAARMVACTIHCSQVGGTMTFQVYVEHFGNIHINAASGSTVHLLH